MLRTKLAFIDEILPHIENVKNLLSDINPRLAKVINENLGQEMGGVNAGLKELPKHLDKIVKFESELNELESRMAFQRHIFDKWLPMSLSILVILAYIGHISCIFYFAEGLPKA